MRLERGKQSRARWPAIRSLDLILNAMGGLWLTHKHWGNLHFHGVLAAMRGMDGRGRCLSLERAPF